MVSSTAMPRLIAAIVMVIISSGISIHPINPKIVPTGIMFAIIAIIAILRLLKSAKNVKKSIRTTIPMVFICESKSDWSILLYITKRFETLCSSSFGFNMLLISPFICLISLSLWRFGIESIILVLILT